MIGGASSRSNSAPAASARGEASRRSMTLQEAVMSVANVDDVRRNVRAAVRRHWVLFLVPGVVMAILGLLAAASPFVATLVVETFAGWLFLTSGFVGLPTPQRFRLPASPRRG